MSFDYTWSKNEANFGSPIPKQVSGGMHITFEIILEYEKSFVALRRPSAIPEHEIPQKAAYYPNGLLYFCHGLIRYGESTEECVKRIVKEQANVEIINYKIIDIWSEIQDKDDQWSFTPGIIAEIESLPKIKDGKDSITEIIKFNKNSIPEDFGWWDRKELREFLDAK